MKKLDIFKKKKKEERERKEKRKEKRILREKETKEK